jgi:hypothetical protein
LPLHHRTAISKRQFSGFVFFNVHQPKVCSRVPDNTFAIGIGTAGIKILMIAVFLKVFPLRSAGINIADTFVIANKVNPVANPHWMSKISFQVNQFLEFAVTIFIH